MRKGYTLIEMVLVVVLVGILATLFGSFLSNLTENWIFLASQKNITLSTHGALQKMTKELRRIQKNTDISSFSANAITFKEYGGATISYSQSGTNLVRNGDVLQENLSSPGGLSFSYLKADGTSASSVADIRIIQMGIKVVSNRNKCVLQSAVGIEPKKL